MQPVLFLLTTIYFDFRLLTIVSLYLLVASCYTLNISCTDYSLFSFWSRRSIPACNVKGLSVTEEAEVVKSVNTEKLTIKENITILIIEDQICHYFPKEIETFLPKLQRIKIINSKLKTITKDDLAPFPDLLSLKLINNDLQYILGDVFSLSKRLQEIVLKDNKLQVIYTPILKSPKNLKDLTLELKCLKDSCDSQKESPKDIQTCISSVITKFNENCVFDSLYPEFKEHLEDIKLDQKECKCVVGECNEVEKEFSQISKFSKVKVREHKIKAL